MDLMCQSAMKVSFMVFTYFIGYALGPLFFFDLADVQGRKSSTIYLLTLCLACETVMVIFPSYKIRTAGFFVIGLTQYNKKISASVWLMESVDSDSQ